MDYVQNALRHSLDQSRRIVDLQDRTSQFFSRRKPSMAQLRNPRLLITTEDQGEDEDVEEGQEQEPSPATYPVQGIDGGNTFPAIFLDGGFDHSAGRHTSTVDLRSDVIQTWVHSLSQNWIPPGTIIQAWQDRGTDSTKPGEWWTPWTDNLRLGRAETYISAGGNGTVMEYGPNNYSAEAAVRTWFVRNRTCHDIAPGAWLYFEQNGSVAYAWTNCGGASESSSTSTSGSDGSGSGSLSSTSTSGPSGSGFSGSIFCCEEVIGDWPDAWPASLALTLSNACCAALNRSFTLAKNNALSPALPSYRYNWAGGPDCDGDLIGTISITVGCDGSGQWTFKMDMTNAFNMASCSPPVSNGPVPLTLLSCSPLQFAPVRGIPMCRGLNQWCNGSMDADITL